MSYEPDYILTLKDGQQIKLLFNNWAFRNYSQRKGIEYEDLVYGCFSSKDGGTGQTLKANNIPGILLIGAEAYCKYNEIPFTYTELDADSWCDQFHPILSEELKQAKLIFSANILQIDINQLKVKAEEIQEDDKKKEMNPELKEEIITPLPGGKSMSLQPVEELNP